MVKMEKNCRNIRVNSRDFDGLARRIRREEEGDVERRKCL